MWVCPDSQIKSTRTVFNRIASLLLSFYSSAAAAAAVAFLCAQKFALANAARARLYALVLICRLAASYFDARAAVASIWARATLPRPCRDNPAGLRNAAAAARLLLLTGQFSFSSRANTRALRGGGGGRCANSGAARAAVRALHVHEQRRLNWLGRIRPARSSF